MRNRIRSFTRWPLDKVSREDVADTEIEFFRVMKKVVGERFVSNRTLQIYSSAVEVKRCLEAERMLDDSED